MTTIWKYPLKLQDHQSVDMPLGAEILTVQFQDGIPCLWAKVDSMMHNKKLRSIALVGTGHPVSEDGGCRYIGTCQQGPFVWHWFELTDH